MTLTLISPYLGLYELITCQNLISLILRYDVINNNETSLQDISQFFFFLDERGKIEYYKFKILKKMFWL